ncbi:membrane protein [Acrocarpospora phusangensis]|uniref:Membrane protein n=1 Tax=Acrocarpospora phusangensis TaxID=1070424 RepID=A0A919QBU1_9ACTN|nr:DUF417 family protein [Acrocarpospora phusangensis]GIH26309.1 membrane protein [Acrocarpospora phusangensis]
MGARDTVARNLQCAGAATLRYGLALNLLWIGRLKFEAYETENIRPLIVSSPPFARLAAMLGERQLARLIGVSEIVIGGLIAARPYAPRASALGSLAGAGMFATTLTFLATTPEAWQQKRKEPKPSIVGQFLLKDIVLLGACLATAAEALRETAPGGR